MNDEISTTVPQPDTQSGSVPGSGPSSGDSSPLAGLGLWELLRAPSSESESPESSKVLSRTRPSVWDCQ